MNVFTYGTLMFPEVWQAVAGRVFETVEGTATGYANFRVTGAVYPGIVQSSDCTIRGVAYLDVDRESVARLDMFEGDFYERQPIEIQCDDGRRLTADAYVVPDANRHVLTDEPWDRDSFIASGGLEQFIARYAGFGRIRGNE